MTSLVVIAHNIRSTHNIGSFFRTCDGFGVEHLYLTGYTPYPQRADDTRLPHLSQKLTAQIHKTALGAEMTVPFSHSGNAADVIRRLRKEQFKIVALEQSPRATMLPNYKRSQKVALLLGEEVNGVADALLALADDIVEIPMHGQKESFNVSVALGIMLYGLCYN